MTIKEQKLFKAGLDILEDFCPKNQEDYWEETLCKRCWEKYLYKVMNEWTK